jgi:hypothetical protein
MALWPIFRVARSSRTDLSMLVARALKIGQIADGGMPPTYETMHYISVNYLGIPFAKHFEQPVSIAQRVNRVLLVSRFDGIFKPGGYAWICKDLFESHMR